MIRIKKIRLRFDSIMTTADMYDKDETVNGVTLPLKDTIKEVQEVLAVGPKVNDIKVGDKVRLDLTRYKRTIHEQVQKSREERFSEFDTTDKTTLVCDIPNELIDGETVFLLNERDVAYIVEEYDDKATPDITLVKQRIITV